MNITIPLKMQRSIDLVESLCGDEPFRNGWQYQLVGVFDEESLKEGFSESRGEGYGNDWDNHGQHFVGKEVTWEVTTSGGKSSRREISNVKYPDDLDITYDLTYERSLPERSLNRRRSGVGTVLHGATHQLNGTSFRRLFADRDIETEQKKVDISLGSDGEGATNIIRRFVATLDDKFPQEVIHQELLDALNLIFGRDGPFSDIQVPVHEGDSANELDGYSEICLREKKKGLIPLSKSGSGLKTVLLVLLNLLVVPKIENKEKSQFTFAFEELENNLHPALLRRLFKYLEDYAVNEKATIFLTTHSSVALDFFGVSDNAQIIRVLHDGESAHTETVHTHSNLIKIISELGARPSDLLQANGLIWVEGPSDRIYLNHWIKLYTDGRLREGRDYQCVFYGGSLIAQVELTSPENGATEGKVNELVNLFPINHNLVVVCDGDRTAEDSSLKSNVERIREEVKKIDDAHLWITEAKEIENYLPGSVLEKATGLSPLPDPEKYESWSSYTEKHMQRKSIDKVALAISSTQYMNKEVREVMEKRFDWKEQMEEIVKRIDSWNKNGSSEGP